MNEHPIDQAIDADLRFSQQAMQRAAVRARETARQTGTSIVVCRNGVLEYLQPQQDACDVAQARQPWREAKPDACRAECAANLPNKIALRAQ